MSSATAAPILPPVCFGRVVQTAAVARSLDPITVLGILRRHMRNDWGDLCPDDAELNRQAVIACDGSRVMSSYVVNGQTVWVISYLRRDGLMTDPDCCNTTVLFPSDY